jgi:hypothetical protein
VGRGGGHVMSLHGLFSSLYVTVPPLGFFSADLD